MNAKMITAFIYVYAQNDEVPQRISNILVCIHESLDSRRYFSCLAFVICKLHLRERTKHENPLNKKTLL